MNRQTDRFRGAPLAPSVADKVAALMRPRAYPQAAASIEPIETHMSWVFLAGRYAYKMKKPVRHDYIDFTTLDARKRNCLEELRLNAPLAPGVYLAVVPLTLQRGGEMRLEGAGETVEWLVKMQRLPALRMLPHLTRVGQLKDADIKAVAKILVDFYRRARRIGMSGSDYCERLQREIDLDWKVLSSPHYEFGAIVGDVHNALGMFLDRQHEMIAQRARHIIEGHGDLRPEHICLKSPPVIFDRLEFSRALRIVDPVDEICFLEMECTRLGAGFVGERIMHFYAETTGDTVSMALRNFYAAHRAYTRARLAALHTLDIAPAAWSRWLGTAIAYLRIADCACQPRYGASNSTNEPAP